MSKRLHLAFSLVFVLTLVGNCFAVNWTDGGSGHLWSTAANWVENTVPTSGQDVFIGNNATGPTIDSTVTAQANVIRMGGTGTTDTLTITGGTLTSGHLILGEGGGSDVTMDMSGGAVNVHSVWVGNNGDGVLNVSGGTMNISGEPLYISRFGGAGHVQLNGGTINTDIFQMFDATASMDLAGGVLIIEGDKRTTVNGYISSGWITAYNGSGMFDISFNASKTTVEGYILTWPYAYNPEPVDGYTLYVGGSSLSWLPGAYATSHNVYLGTDFDEVTDAMLAAGDLNFDGEVNIFDISILATQWLTDPGSLNPSADIDGDSTVNIEDFAMLAEGWERPTPYKGNQAGTEYVPTETLELGQMYYWRIDEVNDSNVWKGDVWSFCSPFVPNGDFEAGVKEPANWNEFKAQSATLGLWYAPLFIDRLKWETGGGNSGRYIGHSAGDPASGNKATAFYQAVAAPVSAGDYTFSFDYLNFNSGSDANNVFSWAVWGYASGDADDTLEYGNEWDLVGSQTSDGTLLASGNFAQKTFGEWTNFTWISFPISAGFNRIVVGLGVNEFRPSQNDRIGFDNVSLVSIGTASNAPLFIHDPTVEADANENEAYSSSIADNVIDPNDPTGETLTFSKISGPDWLSVATDGSLSGTPDLYDIGINTFEVQVSDGIDGNDTAALKILVQSVTYGEDVWKIKCPVPIFDKDPNFIELYWKAWELAHDHLKFQPGLPQSPYMDEAFSDSHIWIWDTCFMTMFCKYSPEEFPGVETLNNFYVPFHTNEYNDGSFPLNIWHPDNPPLFAWVEHDNYLVTGDVNHVVELLTETEYLQKHFDWFDTVEVGWKFECQGGYFSQPTVIDKVDHGYKWGGVMSGMDNSPRNQGGLWVDAIGQQGLSALSISRLAEMVDENDIADEWIAKYESIKQEVNEHYWDANDGIYYDIHADTLAYLKVKTPASYWPMLAEMCTTEQAARMAEHITDPNVFGGDRPWATVAHEDPAFVLPDGGYWRGGIWLPTAYMGTKALEKYGYYEEADDAAEKLVSHMLRTYQTYDPHTIWECYSPTRDYPVLVDGEEVREDFCGWSALGPISLFIENVLGFHVIDAHNKSIEWRLHQTQRNGITNLRFGDITTDIVYDGIDHVDVTSDGAYTLIINGTPHTIQAGENYITIN